MPTADDIQRPGAAPGSGEQDSASAVGGDRAQTTVASAQDTTTTEATGDRADDGTTLAADPALVKKLRDEAAKHRVEARELAKRLAEIEAERQRVEDEKLEAQGRHAEIAKKAQEKAAKARGDLDTYRQRVEQRIARQHVEGRLVAAGFTPAQVEHVLPGVLSRAQVRVTEDLDVEGEGLEEAIQAIAALFTPAQKTVDPAPAKPAAAAPRTDPRATLLAGMTPSSTRQTGEPSGSAYDQTLAITRARLRRG